MTLDHTSPSTSSRGGQNPPGDGVIEKATNPSAAESVSKYAEKFHHIASGFQSLVIAASVLIAGALSVGTVKAKLQEAELEARVAIQQSEAQLKRIESNKLAQRSEVLLVEVIPSSSRMHDGSRVVTARVKIRNEGTNSIRLDLTKDTRFYIARLRGVAPDGKLEFEERLPLVPDYPDKLIEWVRTHPGGDEQTFIAAQKVASPGLYILRFASHATDDATSNRREFGSEMFFVVE